VEFDEPEVPLEISFAHRSCVGYMPNAFKVNQDSFIEAPNLGGKADTY
jgi:hypothetical protein